MPDSKREDACFPRLQLFVLGRSETMRRAIENAQALGDVEVIDVRQYPDRAEAAHILATPTLISLETESTVRIVGDLNDLEAVRYHLGLPSEGSRHKNKDPGEHG